MLLVFYFVISPTAAVAAWKTFNIFTSVFEKNPSKISVLGSNISNQCPCYALLNAKESFSITQRDMARWAYNFDFGYMLNIFSFFFFMTEYDCKISQALVKNM